MPFYKRKAFVITVAALALLVIVNLALYEPDISLNELKAKYANGQSRFIEVDGMPVHYRIEGTGPDLVLVHGTGAILQTWDRWVELLSPQYRIIRMDIPAFGLTGPHPNGDYSDTMYVQFMEHFATKLGLDTFAMAGNSLGGLICWRYAAAHPERVNKLVLVDPGGFYENNKKGGSFIFKMARNYPTITGLVAKTGTHYFVGKTLKEVYADDTKITPQLVTTYTELNRREGNRASFVARAKQIYQHTDDQLKTITCPTLILWGEEDVLIDVAEAEHFKNIPSHKLIVYKNAGHSPQEEIPEQTAKDVEEFLTQP